MNRFPQIFLYPFSLVYGLIMQVRNLMFDLKILPSEKFPLPVISVGNLSYGGTGKTPHVEYLLRLLLPQFKSATLSRGYGRKGNDFRLAEKGSTVIDIGDEPMQFFRKFEHVRVAVDGKRRRGIKRLLNRFPLLDAILLDDAFQHRYVKPGLSILLTDYHRLYSEDFVLPSGTLREFRSNARRADIIVVTKTPRIFSPITRRRILEGLSPAKHQRVYFSYINYLPPLPCPGSSMTFLPQKITNIFLFTGIANDYPLKEHLERHCSEIIVRKFPDHHDYAIRDIEDIIKGFNNLPTQKKILVTTEKDLMRLNKPEFNTKLKDLPLFYIPIEIEFHGQDKAMFDQEILNYVTKNQGNR